MKKTLIVLFILLIPAITFAEWSQPVWTDDCTITVQKDKDGNTTTWTEVCRDEHGVQTSKRTDTYTYYETKELKTINQKVYDSKDAVTSDKTVTHYTDGKPPTVEDNTGIGEEEMIP